MLAVGDNLVEGGALDIGQGDVLFDSSVVDEAADEDALLNDAYFDLFGVALRGCDFNAVFVGKLSHLITFSGGVA